MALGALLARRRRGKGKGKGDGLLLVLGLVLLVSVSGGLLACNRPTPAPVTPPSTPPEPTPSPPPTPAPTPSPTPPPTATPTCTVTPTPIPPTPTPLPTPTDADVIATARAIALEVGGLGIWETEENRDDVLESLAWVVRNRVGTAGFNCSTAEQCASDTIQFQAVGRDPTYEPTQHEQDVSKAVLAAPQSEDPTGNSVFFHDFSDDPGPDWQLDIASPNGFWGFYFYTTEQCPGGPRAGEGCSFVLTPTPTP